MTDFDYYMVTLESELIKKQSVLSRANFSDKGTHRPEELKSGYKLLKFLW